MCEDCQYHDCHDYTVNINLSKVFTLAEVIHAVEQELDEIYDVRDGIRDGIRKPTISYFKPDTFPSPAFHAFIYEKVLYFLNEALDEDNYIEHSTKTTNYSQKRWLIAVFFYHVWNEFIQDTSYNRGVTIEMMGAVIQSACRHYLDFDTIVTVKRD